MQKLPDYPLFFPDATRGMVRSLDNQDVENTGTPGVLVNTYHLWKTIPEERMREMGGIRAFMGWEGLIISDSGGFQAMSIIKRGNGKITDEGLIFQPKGEPRRLLTPEQSVKYQLALKTDLMVVLDDFTEVGANPKQARVTVERTIAWANRSKIAYEAECERLGLGEEERPILTAVNQGGKDLNLRRECNKRLAKIGFTAYGHGGDGFTPEGKLDMEIARVFAESAPKGSLIYGLGVGKPEDIVGCVKLGFSIFDCVLPTRDARHGRLYVYTAPSIEEIDVTSPKFYEYYSPNKMRYAMSDEPVCRACDCHTCINYSRRYLYHLFQVKDALAWRLATIHNLRFYALLMEKLKGVVK